MTHRDDSNGLAQDIQFPDEGGPAWREVLELLAEQGFDGLAEAMQTLLNEAMKLERSQVLGARPYERTSRRQVYANGFKPKTVKTRIGALQLSVPKGPRHRVLSLGPGTGPAERAGFDAGPGGNAGTTRSGVGRESPPAKWPRSWSSSAGWT